MHTDIMTIPLNAEEYTVRSQSVTAVQWQGTEESLRAVQKLIFPSSPLLHASDFALDMRSRTLGVRVDANDSMSSTPLTHIAPGGWVIKHADGKVAVATATEFQQRYMQTAGR